MSENIIYSLSIIVSVVCFTFNCYWRNKRLKLKQKNAHDSLNLVIEEYCKAWLPNYDIWGRKSITDTTEKEQAHSIAWINVQKAIYELRDIS